MTVLYGLGSGTRRSLVAGLAAMGAQAVLGAPIPAAPSPAPIPRLRIVIPANAGGGWDQTGRALGAAALAAGAASEVMYENIGGKGGTIGLARYVESYDAAPDTVLIGGFVMVGAVALQRPAVGLMLVQPVARLTSDYELIVVRADSPIKAAKDVIAQLRENPAGTAIAGGSAGGVDHMFAGMLARLAGKTSSLVYQPFAGGAEVVDAVLSGKAAVGISGFSEFADAVAAGKLRAIGTSSKHPFRGIPAVSDQGVSADLSNWRGVFTGGKVPADRRDRLLEAVRRAVATKEWQKSLQQANWDPSWQEGADFKSFLELDQQMAGVLVYMLKLKAG